MTASPSQAELLREVADGCVGMLADGVEDLAPRSEAISAAIRSIVDSDAPARSVRLSSGDLSLVLVAFRAGASLAMAKQAEAAE